MAKKKKVTAAETEKSAATNYQTFTYEDVPAVACIQANIALAAAHKKGFDPYFENCIIAGASAGKCRITIPFKKKTATIPLWKINTSTNVNEYAPGFLFINAGYKTQIYLDGVLTFFGTTY